MRLRTDTNVTSHDTYAIRGHESDRSHVTHAANRCKPLHSHECGNHPQRSSACSGIDSSCILAPLHFHACKSRTRPCRTVSKHTMRARTSADWQAYLRYRTRTRRERVVARSLSNIGHCRARLVTACSPATPKERGILQWCKLLHGSFNREWD